LFKFDIRVLAEFVALEILISFKFVAYEKCKQ